MANAIRAVAVISANDIAVALDDWLDGSEGNFLARMNSRAGEMGMTSTRFGNAKGLVSDADYTTASDMVVLTQYLIQR